MLTDKQKEYWKNYIKLVGEENFTITLGSQGSKIVSSKFFCGIDPSEALGGESMVQIAINRALEYKNFTSKKSFSFSEFQNVLTSCVQSPFYHLELDHYLPKLSTQLSNRQHWNLIKNCWVMQEFTTSGDRADIWRRVLTLRKPRLENGEKLEKSFIAHRAGNLNGFSWTLDRNVAEWFADRFREEFGEVPIHTKEFRREDVIMFIEDRDENEIVVLPP